MDIFGRANLLQQKIRTLWSGNDLFRRLVLQFTYLSTANVALLIFAPFLSRHGLLLLKEPGNVYAIITIIYLCWLLKLLIIDLNIPNPLEFHHPLIQKQLLKLQYRINGLISFLVSTTIIKNGKAVYLNQLPWHLLIGPPGAGKTSLLSQGGAHFILRKHETDKTIASGPEKSVDWWLTRDCCLIDIPGNYLFPTKKQPYQSAGWRFLLRLIRYWRGKQGISSIILLLPLPTLLQKSPGQLESLIKLLTIRLHELQKIFPHAIPCQLIITKCDQLTGFNAFFADTSEEESAELWGITIPDNQTGTSAVTLFNTRFDRMLARLNQQLLTRLHHEHDTTTKFLIKEFPLELEKLRPLLNQLITSFNSTPHMTSISNIFFTSACQPENQRGIASAEPETSHEVVTTTERALQLIHETKLISRPFFIKKLIERFIAGTADLVTHTAYSRKQLTFYTATASAAVLVTLSFLIMGNDFERNQQYLLSLKQLTVTYQANNHKTNLPEEHLRLTLSLLDKLREKANEHRDYLPNWLPAIPLYTHETSMKTKALYLQLEKKLLNQNIADYLDNYLSIPVNKNTDEVYAALKAYLMLGNSDQRRADIIAETMSRILPSSFNASEREKIQAHIFNALSTPTNTIQLNESKIKATRAYLDAIPVDQLASIILKNTEHNNNEYNINLGTNTQTAVLTSQPIISQVPQMYTKEAFVMIYTNEIQEAVRQAIYGNAVLGVLSPENITREQITNLIKQMQQTYINNYIDLWESLLANIRIVKINSLHEIDLAINQLTSSESPLLQLLQTLHQQTYFDPIASNSPKLYALDILVNQNPDAQAKLYQVFNGLKNLQQYIQQVTHQTDASRAAFELMMERMKNPNAANPITQLKLVASNQSEPIQQWLNQIANNTLTILMQQAGKHIDLSWQQQVAPFYQSVIKNHYPFDANAIAEIPPSDFIRFFGNPGIALNFYNQYLAPFIDTSSKQWQWKLSDNQPLPFNKESLTTIQSALQIHHAFFPNNDDKLFVQFTIQPYQIDDAFQQIHLSINNKIFTDSPGSANIPHSFTWTGEGSPEASVQLMLLNNQQLQRSYPGAWGWFRLLNQAYDSVVDKKQIIINLSNTKDTAKYTVFTNGVFNPILSSSLGYFTVPDHLV